MVALADLQIMLECSISLAGGFHPLMVVMEAKIVCCHFSYNTALCQIFSLSNFKLLTSIINLLPNTNALIPRMPRSQENKSSRLKKALILLLCKEQ